jgi:hypothetical protein
MMKTKISRFVLGLVCIFLADGVSLAETTQRGNTIVTKFTRGGPAAS